jgi:ABC-type sulfate transport system substrate-binding protein
LTHLGSSVATLALVEAPRANVANFNGLEDVDAKSKQKALHTTWREENRKQHNMFQKEVKECMATSHTPKIIIPTNDKG